MINLDKEKYLHTVYTVLQKAHSIAKHSRHEFCTPEHVVCSLLQQVMFCGMLKGCGVDVTKLMKSIFFHMREFDIIPDDEDYEMELSVKMEELLLTLEQRAEDEGQPVDMVSLLESMIALNDTFAAYLLDKNLREVWANVLDGTRSLYRDDKCESQCTDTKEDVEETAKPMSRTKRKKRNMAEDMQALMPTASIIIQTGGGQAPPGDVLGKMMANASRLMGAINVLEEGASHHAGGEVEIDMDDTADGMEQEQPWEKMVTCQTRAAKPYKLVGRDSEINRAIRILGRKTKNNVVFVGEPGVGKSAIVLGMASRIQSGEVPEWLREYSLYSLDMSSLVAGASFHGEFERRVKTILEGAKAKGKCILHIDEIHCITNSNGGGNNTMSAADIMKPYLEDNSILFIGTTTYQEYNKHLASNKAVVRRFQQIDVKEPSAEETFQIITGILSQYEKHHRVKYEEEAVRYAIEQSSRFIADRFLPDKALDIIDEAGSYMHQCPRLNKKGEPMAARYQKVDKAVVNKILTDVCRIDANALASESNESLKTLEQRIKADIYGQDKAVEHIVRSVMMAKAGLTEPEKPLASLLFVGPTGVGKTEVCKVLAQQMGMELVRFDMSEYTEKHTISKLIGSPAGYVGYEEGGLLTDAIRKTPNCVLLLDEIEKAHSDIYNILLQVMDYARLTDNRGNKVDFKNVILVMTSNAGAQYAGQASVGFAGGATKGEAMMKTVRKTFRPEFLNRLSGTVVFNDMDKHMASLILDKKLSQLSRRVQAKNVTISLDDDARQFILEKGYTKDFGAREMDRALQSLLMPILMEAILFGKLQKGGEAHISCAEGKLTLG